VFALAVIGTAGAFGYRALFGSSNSGPPPVIKADTTPSKVIPDKDKDQAAKLINDRVNGSGGQRLVSREERPIDLNRDKPAGVLTQDQSMANGGSMQAPALGSGVVGPDPKKIKTITIRPDQAGMADAAPAVAPQANVPDAMLTQQEPEREPAQAARRVAPEPRQTVTERSAPAPRQGTTASSNAPLSLTPDAMSAPAARPAPAPARTASAPTPLSPSSSSSASGGGYAVQVSSRRSEADAQAALRRMQSQYASVIGGQQVLIRRVDLGAKGVYYRAMVGPFGSSEEANRVCSQLKSAGGSCFVQRN
jgi:cell division protein FtsN